MKWNKIGIQLNYQSVIFSLSNRCNVRRNNPKQTQGGKDSPQNSKDSPQNNGKDLKFAQSWTLHSNVFVTHSGLWLDSIDSLRLYTNRGVYLLKAGHFTSAVSLCKGIFSRDW